MKDLMNDVSEFHKCGGHPVADRPTLLTVDRTRLRLRLILEELKELITSLYSTSNNVESLFDLLETELDVLDQPVYRSPVVPQIAQAGDALTDLMYVIVGMGLEMGLPLDKMWAEVQRANMDKFPGGVALKRPDGKVIKPEGWKPPNHEDIILEHMAKKG